MAQELTTVADGEDQSLPACPHHWVIQPATGPVSPGICQTCGEVREFKNYIEASSWGDDRASGRSRTDTSTVVARAAVGYAEAPEEE